MKTVLVLTYVFPPAAYVGVHRVLRLCRHARQHGWDPVVVAPRPDGVEFIDDNLSTRLPADVAVRRTLDIDPAKWLARRSQHRTPSNGGGVLPSTAHQRRETVGIRPLRRLKHTARELLTQIPDSHIFWVPFAIAAGARILLSRSVDVVFCSTPPHSTAFAAYMLSILFRKPYVLDFRDPWLGKSGRRFSAGKSPWLLRLENAARRRLLARASLIVTVSPGERRELLEDVPTLAPERVVCVTNGYDSLDFPPSPPLGRERSRLVLTHTGTVYGGTAGELFAALESLSEETPGLERILELNLVGEIDPEYDQPVRRLRERGMLRAHGLRPHAEALTWAMQSDVLLILLGGDRFLGSHLPAKTFEYLHLGKPILAVTREGDVSRILQESGQGIIVHPHDVEALKQAIRRLCSAKQAGQPLVNPAPHYAAQFEATQLIRQLTGFLDQALTPIRGSRTAHDA
jgi:glycosyltransferase involved in cell wall biosynthesis